MKTLPDATASILRPLDFSAAPAAADSTAQLASLLKQIQQATRDAGKLIQHRSVAELTASPQAGSWSVAECLDHLARTTNIFLPVIASAIAQAPELTDGRRLRTGALARVFIRNLEPPYMLHFKVLAPLVPQQQDFQAAWNSFTESQLKLAETLRCAAGLAIDRVKIKSPVYARIRYNAFGALRMLVAHERRHLWQMEQILKALDNRKLPTTEAA